MSDALPFPPRPNLAQYKKLARDLQQACQSSDSGAVRQWAIRWQEIIARLHNLEITALGRRQLRREAAEMERRWRILQKSNAALSRCTLTGAQFFIAREHGFTSWPKFARHVQALASRDSPVSNFEAAADAIVSGDLPSLQKLLRDHPDLVRERSTREHRSTLLHYVSANGIEDFRQKTPRNIVEITNLLLDRGAGVNAGSDAYGGGCTALGLVATSVHPEQAGVQIPLLQTLLDRGAKLDLPSSAGNRHGLVTACFANGQPGAARFLASVGAPVDFEAAAALGRLDLVKSYFEAGVLPNQRLVDSAFHYACGYGRKEVVEFLLEQGVDPGLRGPAGRTGLHDAAFGAQVEIIRLLLERGAPWDLKEEHFHATALDVALWYWDNTSLAAQRERSYEVIALLARAGARLDRQHWHDPDSDQPGMLEKIDSDPRMQAALRGEVR